MTFDEIDGYAGVGFMINVFKFVDDQLVALNDFIKKDMGSDGDSNLFGDFEYLTGIGFVAGQRYITSLCGLFGLLEADKRKALELGPKLIVSPGGIRQFPVFWLARGFGSVFLAVYFCAISVFAPLSADPPHTLRRFAAAGCCQLTFPRCSSRLPIL